MIWNPAKKPTREEIEAHLLRRKERDELFHRFGIDRENMVRFVVDAAEPLEEPLLDIGTGKGHTAVELARRGVRVTTIDVSEKELIAAYMHAAAEGVENSIDFHLSDGLSLPFEDGSFRLVTVVNVIHHLDDPYSVFPEISRVIADGGRLILTDFTEKGFELMEKAHDTNGEPHPRLHGVTVDTVADRLGRFGLQCRERDSRFHQYVVIAIKK